MAGGRTKVPKNESPRRAGARGVARPTAGGSRKGGRTGAGGRGKRRGEAKVVSLPQRRSGDSGAPNRASTKKKAVGRGRLRLVLGAVAIVCLSLGARAAQVSVADDDRYQAFAAEWQPASAAEDDRLGRGSAISADGRYLATSLDAAKVVATPYQVEDPKSVAKVLTGVLGSKAGSTDEIETKLTEKNDDGNPSGYSTVAEGIEPEKARDVVRLGLPGVS